MTPPHQREKEIFHEISTEYSLEDEGFAEGSYTLEVNPVKLATYLAKQAQLIDDLYSVLKPSQRIELAEKDKERARIDTNTAH